MSTLSKPSSFKIKVPKDKLGLKKVSPQLTTRVNTVYTETEIAEIECDKTIIQAQIKKNVITKKAEIYLNQDKTSLEITAALIDRRILNVMVLAKTQSGKTGTMIALIQNYLNHPSTKIPIKNIYIITGLSSKDWIDQTRNRMPESLKDQVYHRDKLNNTFAIEVASKKNVLIIIDEVQIAAKDKQSLNKCFHKAGFYNKQSLFKRDVKIVEFTATPDGTLYDLNKWLENSSKIMMEPGSGYTGIIELSKQNRVYQYADLKVSNDKIFQEHLTFINSIIDERFKEPLYHIIRSPVGEVGTRLYQRFDKFYGKSVELFRYDEDSIIEDINEQVLKVKPSKHTFIFIKEKLRCAKTLHKMYLGILYERYSAKPDDTVVIQGLIGRATGYDDNGKTVVFTNKDSIERYNIMWDSKFEDTTIKWKSKTTKIESKEIVSRGTFNSITHMGTKSPDKAKQRIIIKKFTVFKDAFNYTKKELGAKRGPNIPKCRSDGYYENTIRSVTKVMSYDEIYKNKSYGLIKYKYRLHPCYTNVMDKSTLIFCIIHYS